MLCSLIPATNGWKLMNQIQNWNSWWILRPKLEQFLADAMIVSKVPSAVWLIFVVDICAAAPNIQVDMVTANG